MSPLNEVGTAQYGRATILQMVRNRNNLEENKLQRRLLELNKELILVLGQMEEEKLNTYDFIKTLKSCDSDAMSEFRSLQKDIRQHPPSPLLVFPGIKKGGSKMPMGGAPNLQPGTKSRAAVVGGDRGDPRMVKSCPLGLATMSRDTSVLSIVKARRGVREEIQERVEILLREKAQLIWSLEKLEIAPPRQVPPLPPELGGPARMAPAHGLDTGEPPPDAGPISVEASIEIARAQFAAGLMTLRSQTDLSDTKTKKKSQFKTDVRASTTNAGPKRGAGKVEKIEIIVAESEARSTENEARPFESPSHARVLLAPHGEDAGRHSTLTLTRPTFDCSTSRKGDRGQGKEESSDGGNTQADVIADEDDSATLRMRRKQSVFSAWDAESFTAVRRRNIREKLAEMGYVKEKKKTMNEADFMRTFLDRKANGITARRRQKEPLVARLRCFYDKLPTDSQEVKPSERKPGLNLPPIPA